MELRHRHQAASESSPDSEVAGGRDRQVRHGLLLGLLSGLAAISCCVSPVVLVLLGVATAAQAVSLGDALYYEYGWWLRGFGITLAAVAVFLYLRRRKICNIHGTKGYRRMFLTLLASGGVT